MINPQLEHHLHGFRDDDDNDDHHQEALPQKGRRQPLHWYDCIQHVWTRVVHRVRSTAIQVYEKLFYLLLTYRNNTASWNMVIACGIFLLGFGVGRYGKHSLDTSSSSHGGGSGGGGVLGLWIITLVLLVLIAHSCHNPQKETCISVPDASSTFSKESRLNHDTKKLAAVKQHLHACRLEMATLLGSIGAPPMISAYSFDPEHNYDDNNNDDDVVTKNTIISWTSTTELVILQFAKASVELLRHVEVACHHLRIGTSLALGLGPICPCIERVEEQVLRQRTFRKTTVCMSPLTLGSLSRSKTILAHVLIEMNSSMTMFIQRLLLYDRDNTLEDMNGWSMDQDVLHETTIPKPLTLSWLVSKRLATAELLSDVCSHLTTQQHLIAACNEAPSLLSQLESMIHQMQELTQHVVAAFGLAKFHSNDNVEQEKKIRSPSQQQQQLSSVRQLVHALGVVLGNCHEPSAPPPFAIQSGNAIIGVENNDHEVCNQKEKTTDRFDKHQEEELKEWWKHVTDLMNRIQLAKCNMDDILSLQHSLTVYSEDDISTKLENVESGNKVETTTETGLFEDKAQTERRNDNIALVMSKKIKVFSGFGSVAERQRAKAGLKFRNEENLVALQQHGRHHQQQQQRNRAMEQMLVQELAARLQMIPRQEEEEGEEESELATPPVIEIYPSNREPVKKTVAVSAVPRPKSSAVFLGATGSLLDELKKSISHQFALPEGASLEDELQDDNT